MPCCERAYQPQTALVKRGSWVRIPSSALGSPCYTHGSRAEVARRSEPEHAKASARSAHSLRALARFVENDLGDSDSLLSRTLRRSRVADDGSYYVISQDALRVLGRFGIGRGFPTPPRREQFVNVLNRLEGAEKSARGGRNASLRAEGLLDE